MKRSQLLLLSLSLFFLLTACGTASTDKVQLTISAAASLKDAMEDIQEAYQKEHPEVELTFNFGGSGALQQQISQGAPVDLFISAAEDKFQLLVDDKIISKEDAIRLAGNKLVLIVPKDSSITSFQALADDSVTKIALGTPETVPAGAYGKQSLQNMGLWNQVEPKAVYAKDVRQVLSYVETGNVEAGIVYQTDALISNNVKTVETAKEDTHQPIIYPAGVISDSKHQEEAKAFLSFLLGREAKQTLDKYGFSTK
ncbi:MULTISPECIES: molybdate ABC transporter substrate-binding protein [Bacillus]|uniref:Molybdenum ABC transporter substrate-binding protein n=2 Tax=Bacillus TaxID=1386 RepID=A0A0M3RA26_9BACI|nr:MULTISPECIES: molybdate ABC transporter substrate-binding protein [Bacillus]ALC82452.1 molybdenum ABC transporter substrate-binding protein [Bacillus gobiensis]MBP1081336.1 molybdate transport system substrate-binding protein [Bacillus capparidis]MED1096014.1 molybdate ABC transporter substrate-binding protein [Bacillus capparidis]